MSTDTPNRWQRAKARARRAAKPRHPHLRRGRQLSLDTMATGLGIMSLPFLVWALIWLFAPAWGGFGTDQAESYNWFVRNITASDGGFLGLSTTLWLCWAILGPIAAFAMAAVDDDGYSIVEIITIVACVVMLPLGTTGAIQGNMWGDRDRALAYNASTITNVPDMKVIPEALHEVVIQKKNGLKNPDYRTWVDEKNPKLTHYGELATLTQATLPTTDWEDRNLSLSGATKWLRTKTNVDAQGVGVWDKTFTYVYGNNANDGRWSAVINGSGKRYPARGVTELLPGQQAPRVCLFDRNNSDGTYKFNRAFRNPDSDSSAEGLNDLNNVIYRWLIENGHRASWFENEDISGYCDANGKPVITVNILKHKGAGLVTIPVPDCFMILTGSSSGMPNIECKTKVTGVGADKYPVPVYPLSVADTHRRYYNFAAGLSNEDDINWGFTLSDATSQAGNNGNYVLRDPSNSSIWAMSYAKPNKATTQHLSTAFRVKLNSMTSGQLNQMDMYSLPANLSPNPTLFNANAEVYMGYVFNLGKYTTFLNSNFFATQGAVEEYVPLSSTVFRGFGIDRNDLTRFYVDISLDPKVRPIVTILNVETGGIVARIQIPTDTDDKSGSKLIEPKLVITCDNRRLELLTDVDSATECAQNVIGRVGDLAKAGK
ncbi:MAG TPA: hypothetical protein VD735_00905 [Candidatus Saccharimonadales bacterium]|nr:hypothetical protein [Candidatus Saccharimonadales bacterium]